MTIALEAEWYIYVAVITLGVLISTLYALLLSTPRGREIAQRRTHWTVIGGHILMSATMALLSWRIALIWLAASVVHGAPLIIRSEVLRLQREDADRRVQRAALRGALNATLNDSCD